MKSISSILTLAAVCALGTTSAAQETTKAKDVAELEREVRALEARVRTLSAAAAEVAELMTRSAEIWSRAVAGQAPKAEEPAKPAATAKAKPSVAKALPAPRPAEPAIIEVGTVRGKVNVPKGEPIAYAYIENVFAPPVRGKTVVIDQRNKNFVPTWAVIRRGTTVEFPNHDNIYHNVFSHAPGNSFDLGLYNASSPAKTHSFQSPGSVDVYCNIHPSMAASVLVVPNDLFAKVQADGTFVIDNVPTGQRKIVAWSPGTALSTQWVELKAGATANVELALEHKSRVHQNKEGRAYGSYQ
jgi:plastocyanin